MSVHGRTIKNDAVVRGIYRKKFYLCTGNGSPSTLRHRSTPRIVKADSLLVGFNLKASTRLGQLIATACLNENRLCLQPNPWLTAGAPPSPPATSPHLCRPTTSRATRCGSKSWTSTGGKGNAHLRSFRLSIRGNARMQRRDCIIIVSALLRPEWGKLYQPIPDRSERRQPNVIRLRRGFH